MVRYGWCLVVEFADGKESNVTVPFVLENWKLSQEVEKAIDKMVLRKGCEKSERKKEKVYS
jgi:hypothetical protein